MKELTIEEKAKAYDKALTESKKFLALCKKCGAKDTVDFLERIFPELKESEDEKIRKAILALVRQSSEVLDKQNQNNMIAWLEKQGEQNLIMAKSPQLGRQKSAFSYCQENCKGFQETGKCFADGDCKAKREAESIDKVEPKFLEGEWVVFNYRHDSVYQVEKIENYEYTLRHFLGGSMPLSFSHEDMIREWTINDAKDGDVLYSLDSKQPFIFKHRKPHEQAKVYCGINIYGKFFVGNTKDCIITTDKYIPATKDQRDTLERAMTGAGYTFNFEKKELKKLGQSEVTKTSDQEEIAEIPFGAKDSELQEAIYYVPKGFHAEIDDDKVVIKKDEKPTAWTEEDNMMIEETLYFLREYQQSNRCKDENGMQNSVTCEEWLKSLKDRVDCEAKK